MLAHLPVPPTLGEIRAALHGWDTNAPLTIALACGVAIGAPVAGASSRGIAGYYAGFGIGGNALNTELSARPGPGVTDPGPAGAAASLDGLGAAGGFSNSMAATTTNSLRDG